MPPKTSSRLALMGAKPSAASRDVAGVAITSYVCSSFEFEKLQRIKEWLGGEDFNRLQPFAEFGKFELNRQLELLCLVAGKPA